MSSLSSRNEGKLLSRVPNREHENASLFPSNYTPNIIIRV